MHIKNYHDTFSKDKDETKEIKSKIEDFAKDTPSH